MPRLLTALINCFAVAALAEGPALERPACHSGDQEGCSDKCAAGEARACGTLGMMFVMGTGVAVDAKEGRGFLDMGCKGGSDEACINLGVLDELGLGVPKDEAKARAGYTAWCEEKKKPYGCFRLASAMSAGHGGPVDLPGAVALLERACSANVLSGCLNLARFLRAGSGAPKDLPRARSLFTALCDAGHGLSCGELAQMTERGEGASADRDAARPLYVKACDAHSYLHCLRAAELLRGKGAENPQASLEKVLFACDHRFAPACNEAGLLQKDGIGGVRRNESGAVDTWKKGCELNDPTSCANHGWQLAQQNQLDAARVALDKGCQGKSQFACEKLQQLPQPQAEPPGDEPPAQLTAEEKAERAARRAAQRAYEDALSKRTFKVLSCKTDCNKLCRARAPGDACMVRQHKCQANCESQFPKPERY